MWPFAAEATQGGDGLLAAVITIAGLVITGVVTVIVALINRGRGTSPPSTQTPPPPPPQTAGRDDTDVSVRERVRVLEYRLDAKDHDDEVRDRRHDQVERHLDLTNVRWRFPHEPQDGAR